MRTLDAALREFEASGARAGAGAGAEPMLQLRALHAARELGLLGPGDGEEEAGEDGGDAEDEGELAGGGADENDGDDAETVALGGSPARLRVF